jgi:hypothetical protein
MAGYLMDTNHLSPPAGLKPPQSVLLDEDEVNLGAGLDEDKVKR